MKYEALGATGIGGLTLTCKLIFYEPHKTLKGKIWENSGRASLLVLAKEGKQQQLM